MLNEIQIFEEEDFNDRVKLNIPPNWWTISSSYPIISEQHKVINKIKILNLKDTKPPKLKIPKPSYWDISQGDYFVLEEQNSFYQNNSLKKKFLLIVLYFILFGSSALLYFL